MTQILQQGNGSSKELKKKERLDKQFKVIARDQAKGSQAVRQSPGDTRGCHWTQHNVWAVHCFESFDLFPEAFYSLATGCEAHCRSPHPQNSILSPNLSSSETFFLGMSVGTHVKAHTTCKSPSERALPSPARGASL